MSRYIRICVLAALSVASVAQGTTEPALAAQGQAFQVVLDPHLATGAVSGRLYVFLSARGEREPIRGPDWFRPEPFFRLDVTGWKPSETKVVDGRAAGFPAPLDRLPAGVYRVQAILAMNHDAARAAEGEGNIYSLPQSIEWGEGAAPVVLRLDQVVAPTSLAHNAWAEEIRVESRLLTAFHGRVVSEPATVLLPPSYGRQPQRRYPVIYVIPGFGSSHRSGFYATLMSGPSQPEEGETEFIRVLLSGQTEWGHHVYANSATNGPRGDALVEEMIPYVDSHYRTMARVEARFLTGHSSGGWASLWLQVNYPDTFGGVWSWAPDPVDFRHFQGVNLYAQPPANLYRNERGEPRPIARRSDEAALFFEPFCRMDDVLGRGGQMRSFEAVFSPIDADGLPRRLWDRATGQIDPAVAEAWKAYDIRLVLERNWARLGPKLRGKLHIAAAEFDTFYLEGSTRLLAQSLARLGSDAEVSIVPDVDHSSLLTLQRAHEHVRRMTDSLRRAGVAIPSR